MKEYEKLAHDLSNIQSSNVRLTEQVDCRFSRGFVTGFLKARKMAIDAIVETDHHIEYPELKNVLLELGEKEV